MRHFCMDKVNMRGYGLRQQSVTVPEQIIITSLSDHYQMTAGFGVDVMTRSIQYITP